MTTPRPAGDGPRTDTADVTRLAEALCNQHTPTWEHSGPMARDVWRTKAAALLPVVDAMRREYAAEQSVKVRRLLDAIVIRCREGDPRSDWLPVIDRLATEALDALRAGGDDPRTDTAEGLRHEHVWSPWGCWVRRWDSMGTTVVSESYVTLQGGTPITPGWTRTCATCGVEQSR